MAPAIDEGPGWRTFAGALIPLLLAALAPADHTPEAILHAAPMPRAAPVVRRPDSPQRWTSPRFIEGEDLRAYVERASSRLDDPLTMYYVSQALEECRTWATTADDELPPGHFADLQQWMRIAAAEALSAPCRGFAGPAIDSRQIFALLQEAARLGEPHARARTLLFRDIAAPKSDAMAEIATLLATGDPGIVRDVGAFLARGEVSLRYGAATVDARTAGIAWELAACDLGYPCGPMSRVMLTQCAFKGYCDTYHYDEAIARDEDPGRMALAQRLRSELVCALRRRDWDWLGLLDAA
jgi:hypothetical protein